MPQVQKDHSPQPRCLTQAPLLKVANAGYYKEHFGTREGGHLEETAPKKYFGA